MISRKDIRNITNIDKLCQLRIEFFPPKDINESFDVQVSYEDDNVALLCYYFKSLDYIADDIIKKIGDKGKLYPRDKLEKIVMAISTIPRNYH